MSLPRHGGPEDRGTMDSYYQRGFKPHYFKGDTYTSDRVDIKDMTAKDIVDYTRGYNSNEKLGEFKNWF